jgi:hypothetical protein
MDTPIKEQDVPFGFGIHYTQHSFPLCQLQSRQWHTINTTATYEQGHGTLCDAAHRLLLVELVFRQSRELADVDVSDAL